MSETSKPAEIRLLPVDVGEVDDQAEKQRGETYEDKEFLEMFTLVIHGRGISFVRWIWSCRSWIGRLLRVLLAEPSGSLCEDQPSAKLGKSYKSL